MKGRRWLSSLGLALLMAGALLTSPPAAGTAVAAGYDNTDPGLTACWNSRMSLRAYYIFTTEDYRSGTPVAELHIMYSTTCKTVWAQEVNVWGSSIYARPNIAVFNCQRATCPGPSHTSTKDLIAPGKQSHTNQFTVPAPTVSANGAPQPPSAMATGVAWWGSGYSTSQTRTTGVEPFWTLEKEGFKDEPTLRLTMASTCDNLNTATMCTNWGVDPVTHQSRTLYAQMGYSLRSITSVDLAADFNTVASAWNDNLVGIKNPYFFATWCNDPNHPYPCGSDVVMSLDVDAMGATGVYGETRAGYHVFLNSDRSWTHTCSNDPSVGSCAKNHRDSRPIIAHELGHVEGLGHCDMDYSPMCSWTAGGGNWQAGGHPYWTPQFREALALKVAYP